MAIHSITLKELPELYDGKLENIFDRMIAAAIEDCVDRPAVKTARKVTVSVEIKPQIDAAGDCYNVEILAEVANKSPKYGGNEVVCQVRKLSGAKHGGRYQAVFNDLSTDDPDQGVFDGM